jgi:hypothetical protein
VLEDRETGARVDLRQQGAYTFTLAPSAAPIGPLELRVPGAAAGTRATTAPRFAVHLDGVVTGAEGPTGPTTLVLEAPWPNPAQGTAHVRYGLPQAGAARVALYDVLGREVAVLAEGEQGGGWHEATLDAARVAAGVYVLRLEAGREVRTQRLTVAR